MLYKGVRVLDIEPVVYLGEKAKDWQYNQLYVQRKLEQSITHEDIWGIECPDIDMVYIYLPYRDDCNEETEEVNVDIKYLIHAYNKLSQVFDNVKINFYLDNGECFDMTVEEFRGYINK